MNTMNPLTALIKTIDYSTPKLSYTADTDYKAWYSKAYDKLAELTGYNRFIKVDEDFRIVFKKEHNSYSEIRFLIKVESNMDMPCHLLLPKGIKNPPLMISLQGHSTGMHISFGEIKFERDKKSIEGGRDFGIQAISKGMAALCIEQRGFGERKEHIGAERPECHIPTMTELLLGRTMIGARVWDVSRAIDVIEKHFKDIDASRIYITGNSGGGTVSYYSACLDTRIKAVMPSCAISSYRHSIATMKHCVCNHIPHILEYFEMGDLAGLIAPRPLLIVAGKDDLTFPLKGTLHAFEKIQQIYTLLGCKDNCKLIIGDAGHQFYPDLAWPEFEKLIGK